MAQSIQNIISNIEQKLDDQFQDNLEEKVLQSPTIEKQNISNDIPNPEINFSSIHTRSEKVTSKFNETNVTQHKNDQSFNKEAQQKKLPIKQKQLKIKKQIQNNDQDQEQENKYKNLSHKLETALKKISSSKNQFHTLNKNKTVSLLHRFEEHQKKKEKELEEKRKLQQQRKYLGLKSKPDIDPKSRKMAQETSYKPIYERVERILEEKKKKTEQNQEDKKNKQQEEYQNFLEEYNKHAKVNKEDCRDNETYFQDMITWKSKLQKEREEKMKQKKEKEIEGLTFKPELNKRSMKIAGKTKRVPIQQRQIERPKTEYSYYDYKPKVNKKTSKT